MTPVLYLGANHCRLASFLFRPRPCTSRGSLFLFLTTRSMLYNRDITPPGGLLFSDWATPGGVGSRRFAQVIGVPVEELLK
jgi:hypothetical protein